MGVDKLLQIDFTALTQEQSLQFEKEFGDIGGKIGKEGKKRTKQLKIQGKENQKVLQEFTKLRQTANPAAILSQVKNAAPILAPVFIATGLFTNAILKSDEIAKRFVDTADNRINLFVSLQEQALIDNSLQQVIYTTQAGGTSPRDSYNTFNLYDKQVTQDGINTDLSDIGSLD